MTARELSQLYYLNREIEQDNVRLAELEAAAMGTTTKITGLPHGLNVSNKTALAAEIADMRTAIEAKKALCVVEYNRLMRYINGIEDSLIRQILSLRHVNGLSWQQVAAHIGGGNTDISVRVAHSRFLKKYNL